MFFLSISRAKHACRRSQYINKLTRTLFWKWGKYYDRLYWSKNTYCLVLGESQGRRSKCEMQNELGTWGIHASILFQKCKGKRPLCRPRHKCDDNIKINLKQMWTGIIWIKVQTMVRSSEHSNEVLRYFTDGKLSNFSTITSPRRIML